MVLENKVVLLKQLIAFSVCCFILFSNNVFAVDPGLNWKTIENEHLYVHYADGNKDIAERALAITEAAHQRLTKELNWIPEEKTHVVLSDETDLPNGFATPVFFSRTVIYLAPPTSINTLEDFDDWLSTIIFHEYAHIVHLDKSSGGPKYLRNIFGRFFLLFPNLFQPSWVIEGLATHKETYLERGIGRGQSTMFASMMREEVANGLQPISHVNLPVQTWPAGTTRYLYGVYFMTFIVEKYGEDKLQEWIEEYSNNLIPFFINTNAKQTLGDNLTPLWQEYQRWLEEIFQPQIDAIQAKGVTEVTQLSTDAYRTDSVRALSTEAGDEVYYVRNGGYKRASLMHVDADGKSEELIVLNNGADLDVHPEAGLLLTQNEFCNNYTVYKDIYLYNKGGELERLTECGRYLFASWFPDGKRIAAVKHDATRFELQILDERAQFQQVLWRATDGAIIGQIDVSLDGKKIVASIWRRGGGWNLELFNLADKSWKKITSGVSITANPQFSPDGNILFSMEGNGVYNLHRYYSESGKIEQITNLIGGAFQSSQARVDGDIFYAGYSAEGYAIYRLAETQMLANPVTLLDDKLELIDYSITPHQQKDYAALDNMYPRWWFPALQFSEQRSEFGLTTLGGDALGVHNYSLTATYDTKLERPAGQLGYAYADRLFLSAVRLNEITLDTSGNLDRISKRNIASAVLAFPEIYIKTQSDLLFSLIYDTTADAELAPSAIPLEEFEDNLLGLAWLYNSSNYNPLSISLTDGMKLRLVAEDSDILNSNFSGQVYTFDWKQYIRTGRESVFALRFLQGWGTEQPREFKLGGEGYNDDAVGVLLGTSNEAVFNQRNYALRGYKEGLPQLRGRHAQLLSAEWRFPLQRIEKGIMTPPVGMMQWYGTIFAETGSAYRDSPESYYSSSGIELTADINLFYNLTLRTRAGYAHGFDEEIGDDRLYIKIGSSY
jgi:hypothetical protein